MVGSSRISIRGETVSLWQLRRWSANDVRDRQTKLHTWQHSRGHWDICPADSDWLIPESTETSAEVPEVAGEPSSTAVHWRMEKKSPQRNMATRIADRAVDFLAVGFLDTTSSFFKTALSEDSVVEVGSVAVVKVEEEGEGCAESSPHTLPVVVSSHLGDLPRCFMNECCLSWSLNTQPHSKQSIFCQYNMLSKITQIYC